MNKELLRANSLPCIWMSAGVLSYRLCDRAYECEACPLDAALRQEQGPGSGLATEISPPGILEFPQGCRYTSGHLWLRAVKDGRHRLGLDSFAACLLPVPTAVRWPQTPRSLAPGDLLCQLIIGAEQIPLAIPFAARLLVANPLLTSRPSLLLTDSYGAGWIAEIECDDTLPTAGIDGPAEAEVRARFDLRRFRRRIALHLLADTTGLGPTQADGGARLTDLRLMVGFQVLVALLRQLIH